MALGGKRPGAGRPKGTRNKRTLAQHDALKGGLTPLEYFAGLYQDEECPTAIRLDAAKAAAPYVHQRLAITEQIIHHDKAVAEMSEPELVAIITEEGSGTGTADEAQGEGESSRVH